MLETNRLLVFNFVGDVDPTKYNTIIFDGSMHSIDKAFAGAHPSDRFTCLTTPAEANGTEEIALYRSHIYMETQHVNLKHITELIVHIRITKRYANACAKSRTFRWSS